MDDLEIKAEKITTELMQELANLLGEVDSALFEGDRHQIIHSKISMAISIGFNIGRKRLQQRKSRKVIQCSLTGQPIKLWNSMHDASKMLDIDSSDIRKVASNMPGRKTAGGYRWEFSTI